MNYEAENILVLLNYETSHDNGADAVQDLMSETEQYCGN